MPSELKSAKGRRRPMKDFDPESVEMMVDDDSDSDVGSDPENLRNTEHYVDVGKNKRKGPTPLLGPAYRGTRVSREQLEKESFGSDDDDEDDDEDSEDDEEEDGDEEFDDPDEVDINGAEEVTDSEDEIDSDDALGPDDSKLAAKFVFRGSSKPKDSVKKSKKSKIEDDEGEGDSDEDEDEEEDDDDEEDDEEIAARAAEAEEEDRKKLEDGQKGVLATLSKSAKSEVAKGLAIRQQRSAYDTILNMRIRLQKALTAANSLHMLAQGDEEEEKEEDEEDEDDEDEDDGANDGAIADATSKAIELLTAIQNIRTTLYLQDEDADGKKKKRKRTAPTEADADRSCQAIFNEMSKVEEVAMAKRRKVLNQWSSRLSHQSSSASQKQKSTTDVLDNLLDDKTTMERMLKSSRTPRSGAPLQSSKHVNYDPEIYDDTDFYQALLQELVKQRAEDEVPGAAGSGASALAAGTTTVRWAVANHRESRTRKTVDRRASKGRKMRYTVIPKLEKFMEPRHIESVDDELNDRLLSNLFGQTRELDEPTDDDEEDSEDGADRKAKQKNGVFGDDDDDEEDDDDDDEEEAVDGGLLFR